MASLTGLQSSSSTSTDHFSTPGGVAASLTGLQSSSSTSTDRFSTPGGVAASLTGLQSSSSTSTDCFSTPGGVFASLTGLQSSSSTSTDCFSTPGGVFASLTGLQSSSSTFTDRFSTPGEVSASRTQNDNQDFLKPSSFICAKGEGKLMEWSRSYRVTRHLQKASSDPAQTKNTDFFQYLNSIEKLMKKNETLSYLLQQSAATSSYTHKQR